MKIIKVQQKLSSKQLKEVIKILRGGGLVIYPTETCYGVGALASSKKGVDKLLRYKRRPEGKAISVAVLDRNMASKYVQINEVAENFYENYLPGPYTVISNRLSVIGKSSNVDERLLSEQGTLGIRIPDHPIPLQIIEALGEGITATSANVSSGKTPYEVSDILDRVGEKQKKLIDLVIDYGKLPSRPSSTVVDTTASKPVVLRGNDKLQIANNKQNSNLKSQKRKKREAVRSQKLEVLSSGSEEETYKIAGRILNDQSSNFNGKPIVFLLSGELGAGKTQFVKGLARALGIEENVVSPTFVLERQYEGKIPSSLGPGSPASAGAGSSGMTARLYHYDLWRLESGLVDEIGVEGVVKDIGIDKAIGTLSQDSEPKTRDIRYATIVAVEWPERVPEMKGWLTEKDAVVVEVEIVTLRTKRELIIRVDS